MCITIRLFELFTVCVCVCVCATVPHTHTLTQTHQGVAERYPEAVPAGPLLVSLEAVPAGPLLVSLELQGEACCRDPGASAVFRGSAPGRSLLLRRTHSLDTLPTDSLGTVLMFNLTVCVYILLYI